MGKLFGTDGVRGVANRDLTAALALKLSIAAANVLVDEAHSKKRAIVGTDSRISGEFLSAAVCAGLASAGVDVTDIGVLPTPGIAYLTNALGINLGVVISASHNSAEDNGIKFFSSTGDKLPDSLEDEIEKQLETPAELPIGKAVGKVLVDKVTAQKQYIQHLTFAVANEFGFRGSEFEVKSWLIDNQPFNNVKIVIDSANGAASLIAPEVFRELGAEVIVINSSPDGFNINLNSGSTHPEQLQAMVIASEADFGVAFDGDADRCLAVDEFGNLIDGDQIIAVLASKLKAEEKLVQNTVVLTVMSNLGILNALKSEGIDVVKTQVGDRYVRDVMKNEGYILGGEQSGHIIYETYSTTGDGILTALLLTSIFATEKLENNKLMSQLVEKYQRLPQTLINVANVKKNECESNSKLQNLVKEYENKLGDQGRILLRASGTENLIRVMVEASSQAESDSIAKDIAKTVKEELEDVI